MGRKNCIAGEWFFEQMSSIKTRKHYVIFDMAFSGLWAFFYFVTFIYMCIAWSKTEEIRFSFASSNIYGAIFFAFLSIFAWVSEFEEYVCKLYKQNGICGTEIDFLFLSWAVQSQPSKGSRPEVRQPLQKAFLKTEPCPMGSIKLILQQRDNTQSLLLMAESNKVLQSIIENRKKANLEKHPFSKRTGFTILGDWERLKTR